MPDGSDCGIPSSVKGVSNANLVRLVFFWKCVRQSSSTTAAPQFRCTETERDRDRARQRQREKEQRQRRDAPGSTWVICKCGPSREPGSTGRDVLTTFTGAASAFDHLLRDPTHLRF